MPYRNTGDVRFYVHDSLLRHVGITSLTTTRHTGVSPAPYDTLNLGAGTDDDPAHVAANRGRLSLLTSHGAETLTLGAQVHGDVVAVVEEADTGRRFEATDALITDAAEVPLMILVADCVAVALYDPIKKAIGLAHAGWRGTVAGIAPKTVTAMMDTFGTDPADIVASISPSIGPCCYEVGADVVERFHAEQPLVAGHVFTPAEFASAGSFEGGVNEGRMMLNLWRANVLQLVSAGVFEANVDVAAVCTSCNTGEFFSHRAENGRTGRCGALMMIHDKTKRSY